MYLLIFTMHLPRPVTARLFIHSFIHYGDLYNASSRLILRSAPDPCTAKRSSFQDDMNYDICIREDFGTDLSWATKNFTNVCPSDGLIHSKYYQALVSLARYISLSLTHTHTHTHTPTHTHTHTHTHKHTHTHTLYVPWAHSVIICNFH